jgi:MFS family permease
MAEESTHLGWLISGARLGQAYGYRRAFLGGGSLFTAASLACGPAPDPAVLIVARVVPGAGAGLPGAGCMLLTAATAFRATRPTAIAAPAATHDRALQEARQ